ncbi:erythromycin esterase family protein [Plantactinospora sp. CA-290183]|uniref:erythromycin esterase family protein n=1 Tax=Plantactinospora sp. CA-290183 TaxID=3240006 RepID=UPI003D925AF9
MAGRIVMVAEFVESGPRCLFEEEMMPSTYSRRTLLAALPGAGLTAVLGTAAVAGPAAARPAVTGAAGAVRAALTRAARPLRTTELGGDLSDLRPLGVAIGGASVVGLGEVVHGAHELFALKHRAFRYLVREKGFTTFALETSWTAGLRLNDHVLHGIGNPRAIMAEEFGVAWPWNVHEILDLIRWMRAHNLRHPTRPVQFMGTDMAHPRIPTSLFERVTGYAARQHPALEPQLTALYRELHVHATTAAFMALPQPDRRRIAENVREAHRLLAAQPSGPDRTAFDWAVQHARVLAQTATLLSYDLADPQQIPQAMRYRDELMADNTAWWNRHTDHKILLSAHNGHTAYQTYDPEHYPVIQGTYLRQLLGADYMSIGTTFGHGASTVPEGENAEWTVHRFDPPRRGSSEHTLDQIPHRAYLIDLRTAPPPAREWLHQDRPTRDIGPPGDPYRPYTLAHGHDVLVHLHNLRPATPLSTGAPS